MTIDTSGWGIGCDWVTCVIPDNTLSNPNATNDLRNFRAKKIISRLFRQTGVIIDSPASPHWGYQYAVSLSCGGVAQWAGHKQDMGMCLVLPGRLLDAVRSSGQGYLKRLFSELAELKVKVSRVDIAIDFTNMYDILEFDNDARTGLGNKSRKVRIWETVQGGSGVTYYVGSRNSDRFVRIYDKAAQKGVKDVVWVRFEIETKRKIAQQYFYAIANSDINDILSDISQRYPIKSIPVWDSIEATPSKMLLVEETRDTEKWVKSIIGAIVRGAMAWGLDKFAESFNHWVYEYDGEKVLQTVDKTKYS